MNGYVHQKDNPEDRLNEKIRQLQERNKLVEEENENLKEELRQIKGTKSQDYRLMTLYGLTPSECLLLEVIRHKPHLMTKTEAMAAMYDYDYDEVPDPKIVDVYICKIRQKLKRHGVVVKTVWGQGHYLDKEAKQKIAEDLKFFESINSEEQQ